jgi:sugar (pentulose or hexulose) kinase
MKSGAAGSLLLCLDIGTSACKGLLIDAAGRAAASIRQPYPLIFTMGGVRVEQEPEVLWNAVGNAIAALTSDRARAGEVGAVSLSSQMGTHLLADAEGRALTRFVSWMDRRAEQESRDLTTAFTPEQLAAELGATLPYGPSWALPKLKWWRHHEPALLDRARYLVQPKEWIIWKFCGTWMSDLSSLRGLRHQESGRVSTTLAQWAGIDPDLAPPVAEPDSVAGTLDHHLASEWGLRPGTPVIVGWNDLAAALLGSLGLPDRPTGFDITGTSEHLGAMLPNSMRPPNPAGLGDIPLGKDHRVRYGVTSSSGGVLQWYWEQLRAQSGTPESYSELEREIASAPSGSDGLLFLPCINGERAPWFNPRARGSFYGISSNHRHAHFSRAVLEGIAFTLRSIQTRLGPQIEPGEFRVLGGASVMDAWNQMKADILQVPFVTLECPEAGCLGAAILGAKAIGWHGSLKEAARAMIRTGRAFSPGHEAAARLERQHLQFEKLYRSLEPLFAES